jgi:hypothetical protein
MNSNDVRKILDTLERFNGSMGNESFGTLIINSINASGEDSQLKLSNLYRYFAATRNSAYLKFSDDPVRRQILRLIDRLELVFSFQHLCSRWDAGLNHAKIYSGQLIDDIDLLRMVEITDSEPRISRIVSIATEFAAIREGLASTEIDPIEKTLLMGLFDLTEKAIQEINQNGLYAFDTTISVVCGKAHLILTRQTKNGRRVEKIKEFVDWLLRFQQLAEISDQGLKLIESTQISGLLSGPTG